MFDNYCPILVKFLINNAKFACRRLCVWKSLTQESRQWRWWRVPGPARSEELENTGNPDIDKQLPQVFMECRHHSDVNFHYFGNLASFVCVSFKHLAVGGVGSIEQIN